MTLSIENEKFGRLLVIERTNERKHGAFTWRCRCDCGSETIVKGSLLKRGITKSCGCISIENGRKLGDSNVTHGMSYSPTFKSWGNMRSRCNNPNDSRFQNYHGRGIKVCKRWQDSFENFFADMGLKPKNKSLDRIDNNGDYTPKNCRWASPRDQANNRTSNLVVKGKTLAEWCRSTGIEYSTARERFKKGYSLEVSINPLPLRDQK